MFLVPHVVGPIDDILRYENLQIKVLRPTTQAAPSLKFRERRAPRAWPRHRAKPFAANEVANNLMLKLQNDLGFRKRFNDPPETWGSAVAKAEAKGISVPELCAAMYTGSFGFIQIIYRNVLYYVMYLFRNTNI